MRIANRLLAFVVAAALVAASIVIIVEVIAARSNAEPLIVHWDAIKRWGERNTWQAGSVKLAAGVALLVGLVLLVPQLRRGRAKRMEIATGDTVDSPVQATLTRKSVAQAVRSAVNDVDTITNSRVKVRKRAIVVAAESSSLDPDLARGLIGQVEDAANGQLAALRLTAPPRVRASVGYRRTGRV